MFGKLPAGNQRGAPTVEYVIIIALVSTAVLLAVMLFAINA